MDRLVKTGSTNGEQFISEPIEPLDESFHIAGTAAGEPALPMRFRWRGEAYEVARVEETWKTTGKDHSGSDERYVRKHWFRVATRDGTIMKLYFERQPRSRDATARWWLATLSEASAEPSPVATPPEDAERGP
jgi:hypothetical protein